MTPRRRLPRTITPTWHDLVDASPWLILAAVALLILSAGAWLGS